MIHLRPTPDAGIISSIVMLDLSREEAQKDIDRLREDAKSVVDRIYAIREGKDVPNDDTTSAAVSILRWADNNKKWSRERKKTRKQT